MTRPVRGGRGRTPGVSPRPGPSVVELCVLPEIFVRGVPVAQGSLGPRPHRTTGEIVTPQKRSVVAWREQVAWEAKRAWLDRGSNPARLPWDGPVGLDLTFRMPRPRSAPKGTPRSVALASTSRDLDKLYRAVGDALEGLLYTNDARITTAFVRKRVVFGDEPTGVLIRAWQDQEDR